MDFSPIIHEVFYICAKNFLFSCTFLHRYKKIQPAHGADWIFLLLLLIDSGADALALAGRAGEEAAYDDGVVVVPAVGEFDVFSCDGVVVCRIKTVPGAAAEGFYPGVGDSFSRDEAYDVARRDVEMAEQGDHDVGVVLADPFPKAQGRFGAGVDVGGAGGVGHALPYPVHEHFRHVEIIVFLREGLGRREEFASRAGEDGLGAVDEGAHPVMGGQRVRIGFHFSFDGDFQLVMRFLENACGSGILERVRTVREDCCRREGDCHGFDLL